eukprot:scaffold4700_cov271-Pinguiococcus_pyrenoidosus.AAC.8
MASIAALSHVCVCVSGMQAWACVSGLQRKKGGGGDKKSWQNTSSPAWKQNQGKHRADVEEEGGKGQRDPHGARSSGLVVEKHIALGVRTKEQGATEAWWRRRHGELRTALRRKGSRRRGSRLTHSEIHEGADADSDA